MIFKRNMVYLRTSFKSEMVMTLLMKNETYFIEYYVESDK